MTEAELRVWLETVDRKLERIATCLVGIPNTGDTGLVGKVNYMEQRQTCFDQGLNRLKRHFWMLVAMLVGSGVLAGSVVTLITGG